jgi:transposase
MHTTTQPTIWEVPDDVWTVIESILNEYDPAKPTEHRRVDLRRVLNGIIFRLRTGCPWHQLSQQLGDDRTVHRLCSAIIVSLRRKRVGVQATRTVLGEKQH